MSGDRLGESSQSGSSNRVPQILGLLVGNATVAGSLLWYAGWVRENAF